MFGVIIAAAATVTSPAYDASINLQFVVGACERHLTREELALFDPTGVDVRPALIADLKHSRQAGREEARVTNMTRRLCDLALDRAIVSAHMSSHRTNEGNRRNASQ